MIKTQHANNKAVGYVRVSTALQDCSLEVQTAKIAAYCALNGLHLVETLIESSVSGKTQLCARPQGKRIAEYIDDDCTNVVAMKLDRLFRNAADALNQTEEWNRADIALHLVDMGGSSLNTRSAIGRMMLTMMAGFAEFERNMIAERTTAALQHKKATGLVYSGVTPYGKQRTSAGLLIDEQSEQIAIVEMIRLRESGLSYQSIADELTCNDVPTKTGATWHATTVKKILDGVRNGITQSEPLTVSAIGVTDTAVRSVAKTE